MDSTRKMLVLSLVWGHAEINSVDLRYVLESLIFYLKVFFNHYAKKVLEEYNGVDFFLFKYLDWISASTPLGVTDMRVFCSLNGKQNDNHCIR